MTKTHQDWTLKNKLVFWFKTSVSAQLTERLVLCPYYRSLQAVEPFTHYRSTEWIRNQIKFQCWRLFNTSDSRTKSQLSNCYRCNPSGWKLDHEVWFCGRMVTCPWCYIRRRVLPVLEMFQLHLTAKIQNLNFVTWQRTVPYSQPVPFYTFKSGPHRWFNSWQTVQLGLPFVTDTGELATRFVGLMLVDDLTAAQRKQLGRKVQTQQLQFTFSTVTSTHELLASFQPLFTLPWHNLFAERNLAAFQLLFHRPKKQRLMRVNKTRFKG